MLATAIFALVLCGNIIEVISQIKSDLNVKKDETIDIKQASPLHFAVFYGELDTCRNLLNMGADVNFRDIYGRVELLYIMQL